MTFVDLANKTAEGNLVVAPSYTQFSDANQGFKGLLIEAAADTTTIYDHEITNEVKSTGGSFWCVNANQGDYVEVSLVDKDDVLGLFTQYGLTVGVDVLELGKWVQTLYLKPGTTEWAALHTDDVAPLLDGLYLRVKYENVGSNNAVLGALFEFFYAKE